MNSYEQRIYMDKRFYVGMANLDIMNYVEKLVTKLINEGYADADIVEIVDEPGYDITEVREYLRQKELMEKP